MLLALYLLASPWLSAQAAPDKLPTVHSIGEFFWLSKAEARKAYPVEIQAVVTYSDPKWGSLFVQDRTGRLFITVPHDSPTYQLGAQVRVNAVSTVSQFGIDLESPRITVLGLGVPPPAEPHSIEEIDAGKLNSHFVLTEGVLRPCNHNWFRVCYRIWDGKKSSWVFLPQQDNAATLAMEGALVKVRGTIGGRADSALGDPLSQIYVTSLNEIHVEAPSAHALTAIRDLNAGAAEQRFVRPVHLQGVVIWGEPGRLFLQDATGSLLVTLAQKEAYHTGMAVDLTGFPAFGEFGLELTDATVLPGAVAGSPKAILASFTSAVQLLRDARSGSRVHLKGRLIEQHSEVTQEVFQLEDGSQRFTAVLPRGDAPGGLVALSMGEELDVTGVEVIRGSSPNWPGSLLVLVDTPADIQTLGGNSWMTPRRALILLAGLVFCVAAPLIWVSQLRRTVRRQTGVIRAKMENELKLESQFRRLFERNLASVFTWRADGTIVDCNLAFARLLSFSMREEAIGRSYWDFVRDPQMRQRLVAALEQGPVSNHDSSLHRDDNSIIHLLMNITPLQTGDGLMYETTAIDVTQLKQNQAELQRARDAAVRESLVDPLTGLPNRRQLIDSLDAILERSHCQNGRVALLYIDLDGFKLVNDSLGHAIGDRLLVQVGAAMRPLLGEGDLFGRLGGDEFLAILDRPRTHDQVTALAEQLLAAVSIPFYVMGHKLTVGASIGVCRFPEDAATVDELMQQADRAMYIAKREGKNRVMHYSPAIGTSVRERLKLENHLRSAIERGEISLDYQPEFDAVTHRIVRFEALARWNHPTLGVISPVRFIPIAEESGQIGKLGAYLMELACQEAVCWQDAARQPIQVAVNVSCMQFRRPDFVDEVRGILERTGLSPDLLQIELTESVMLNNPGTAQTMNELRALGISLAIDDFGTGYSNLSYLPSLPFDSLKIDGSFLRDIEEPVESESMIRTLTDLAHNFGMKVVAEGIETPEQLEMIRSLGVNELQGFLMGRPTEAPVIAFLQWIAEQGGPEEAFSPDAPIPERAN